MDSLILFIDRYLIFFYRLTGIPVADYFLGTFIVAFLSVIAGEISVLLLTKVNGVHIAHLDNTLTEKYALSLEAAESGNTPRYRRLNREANEAFGKVFFNMFTFSAATLWCVFIMLAWMQSRFNQVELSIPSVLPFPGDSAGYVSVFLLSYILSRVLMNNLKLFMTRCFR